FRRLDVEHLVDFMREVGEAALVALEALLGARRLLACARHRLQSRARAAVGLGERILALGQAIGSCAARRFSRLDLVQQGRALLCEKARSIFEARALGLRLLRAR